MERLPPSPFLPTRDPHSGARRGSPHKPCSQWGRTRAASLLVPVILVTAACAGAQQPTPDGPAPDEEVRPPEGAGAPSVRREWLEDGASARTEPSVVSVTGAGQVQAEPDRARVHFAVETEGESAADAGEENASLMTEVTRSLQEAGTGLPGFDVETTGYALMPQYGGVRDGRREIVGYLARNSVRVTVDDVETVGPLIDTALGAGANRVSSLYFELQDPEPHRHRAVTEAIRTARAEAEVIAEALGMSLGPVLAVEGGADRPQPYALQMDGAAMRVEAAPTPVEPGMQTVTANVTVRFRLIEAQ